ncbi:MAG: hypothetical protein RLO51_24885 [Thalassobaculum sp.]|uniref:hypothetical protein n=1 Tax=Thalassobaculum sp. TaxID=2022740 RepID=UPI0032EE6E64
MDRRTKEQKGERQAQLEDKPFFGADEKPAPPGSSGGNLARDVGSRDTLKRSRERPGGTTRVRKSDEPRSR